MSLREEIGHALDRLPESELREVADFISYVRHRARRRRVADQQTLATLYAEAAADDTEMAEAGLSDYAAGLSQEDAA